MMQRFYFHIQRNRAQRLMNTTQKRNKPPVTVSHRAWKKMTSVLNHHNNYFAFLFSAKSGGCNGFNYNLEAINQEKFNHLIKKTPIPICIKEGNTQLVIDQPSELLLLGSSIDYIEEDYTKKYL